VTVPEKKVDPLWVFTGIGASAYCRKYGFQCCNMCEREECGDNTNPLVAKIKSLAAAIEAAKGE